jgi:putative transposase
VLAEAFRWSLTRRVTKTATVSLFANRYGVDPALIGRTVELRFDPEDLTTIDVYEHGIPAGTATPFVIGRHTHPAVPQAAPPPADPEPGIDYLGLIHAAQSEALGEGSISYRDLRLPGFEDFDQPDEEDGHHHAETGETAS